MLKNAAVALLETGAFPRLSEKRSNDAAMDKGTEQRLILSIYEPKKAGAHSARAKTPQNPLVV
jgi:hypothetical protein